MVPCRLTRSVLFLGVCLLPAAERSFGQPTDAPQSLPRPMAGPPTAAPMFTPGSVVPNRPMNEPTASTANSAPPSAAPSAAPTGMAMVSAEVVGPAQLLLGQSLVHEIVLRNMGNRRAIEVHVEEALPAGIRVVRTEPAAQTRDNRLCWDIGALEAGAEKRLKVQVQPAGTGELHLRPTVSFQNSDELRTQVIRPPFGIELTADHPKVVRGGRVTFSLRVINRGELAVPNVKLTATLPPGLHHPAADASKKRAVGMTLGDLQPGESRPITLETTAAQAGPARIEVVAQADGGIEARASLDVDVAEPTLSLRVDGPRKGVTRRDLDYRLELSNPGPMTAQRPRLVQALPPGFDVVGASTGAMLDPAQHALVWTLPDLAPQQRQVLLFRIRADAVGDWPLYTSVVAENVSETRVATVLHAEGAALLKLEIHGREEQLAVGNETVYEMHIFNQGDAPCTAVQLTAALPEEVTFLEAKGPSAVQTEKQQVRFAPLPKLPARGDTVYFVRVRAKQGGRGNIQAELTAEKQPPVQSAISVQVNGSPSVASGARPVGHTEPTSGETPH